MILKHEVDLLTGTSIDIAMTPDEEEAQLAEWAANRVILDEKQAESERKAQEAALRAEAIQSILEEAAARPEANQRLKAWRDSRTISEPSHS